MLSTFYVLVSHLHVFFGKKICLSLLPIFSWITWDFFLSFFFFFALKLYESFTYFRNLPLIKYMVWKYFLPFLFLFSLSHIISLIASSLSWLFPLLCRTFLIWHSPTCWFLLLLPMFLLSYPKKSCKSIFIHRWHEV